MRGTILLETLVILAILTPGGYPLCWGQKPAVAWLSQGWHLPCQPPACLMSGCGGRRGGGRQVQVQDWPPEVPDPSRNRWDPRRPLAQISACLTGPHRVTRSNHRGAPRP